MNDGWMKLTDMLRASTRCKTAAEVVEKIDIIRASTRAKIMRLKPRFGPKKKNLNDVTVNFEY